MAKKSLEAYVNTVIDNELSEYIQEAGVNKFMSELCPFAKAKLAAVVRKSKTKYISNKRIARRYNISPISLSNELKRLKKN